MPDKHHRRSIRLAGYDYAQPGAYFVTICTRDHACLFGHAVNGEMHLNDAGKVAQRCWEDIPNHFPSVELDAFVIMPNHVHGVIVITEPPIARGPEIVIPCKGEASAPPDTSETQSGSHASPLRQRSQMCTGEKSFAPTHAPTLTTTPQSPSRTIGSVIRGFKTGVTKWFRANTDIYSVWLRNYYEHVVRDETELDAIREYIVANPALWDDDENNPAFQGPVVTAQSARGGPGIRRS